MKSIVLVLCLTLTGSDVRRDSYSQLKDYYHNYHAMKRINQYPVFKKAVDDEYNAILIRLLSDERMDEEKEIENFKIFLDKFVEIIFLIEHE